MMARARARAGALGALLPGSGLAAVLALAATFVAQLHGGPQMLYALFFGVALNYLSQESRTKPGIEFCARQLLRLGVGLLGARITASQIAGLGWFTALTVVAAAKQRPHPGLSSASSPVNDERRREGRSCVAHFAKRTTHVLSTPGRPMMALRSGGGVSAPHAAGASPRPRPRSCSWPSGQALSSRSAGRRWPAVCGRPARAAL